MSGAEPIFDPWDEYVVPPFPLDVLSEDVRRFVETQSRVIGCDPSAVAMSVLAACSGALDHRFALRMLRNGNWYAHPRPWVLLVGDPSRKKAPAITAATRCLEGGEHSLWDDWERERASAHRADPKAQEPPKPPRYVLHDVTTEKLGEILARQDRGVLVKRDEIAGWLGGMERYSSGNKAASADRAFWLQAYDGGSFTVDRIKRGEQRIRNLSVSVLGGIQPQRLKELHGLTSDGLLQRFVPVMVGKASFPIDEPTDAALDAYRDLTLALVNAAPATVVMTDDAYEAATEARRRLHDLEQVGGGLAPGFQAFVGKLPGVLGSLALILHLIAEPHHGSRRPVEATTVLNAARLVEDFILPHAFEFYRTSDSVTDGDRLQQVASWILTSGKTRFVASDFTTNVASFRGLGLIEVNRRLSPLVAGGWFTPFDDGPIAKSWTVNPAVFEQLKERAQAEERRKAELAKLMRSPRRQKGLDNAA
jgi:Protein of unknown function (DUF3987)